MLAATDLLGMYAIIPTPSLPGAEKWDALSTVNLTETSRLLHRLIDDGIDGLIALGTTGECATLTQAEFKELAVCIVETVAGRIPTFIGATALGLHEVVERLKFLQSIGATGSLLGLPMWQPLTTEMAVDYYATLSQAFPHFPIMVYGNARAFRFSFPTEFWGQISKFATTVIAAKVSNSRFLAENIAATSKRINFLPSDMVAAEFFELSPETTTACWATAASMGPAPSVGLMQAIRSHDIEQIQLRARQIAWANEPIEELIQQPELFASYNIQIEKVRINVAGYCDAGPIRPPYNHLPKEYQLAAEECGHRWVSLCRDQVS